MKITQGFPIITGNLHTSLIGVIYSNETRSLWAIVFGEVFIRILDSRWAWKKLLVPEILQYIKIWVFQNMALLKTAGHWTSLIKFIHYSLLEIILHGGYIVQESFNFLLSLWQQRYSLSSSVSSILGILIKFLVVIFKLLL